ncbi:hypothetical protein TNCT_576791 [Trichonephila clavata]|uniref:Uncharacterized protein n=1 Tax=Trichonephila clavata TaxID=2740835 RepID=A0A8X6JNB8_TRICU|nr:hypothetical protein TNCT_576791 [Trichonephila clavata]
MAIDASSCGMKWGDLNVIEEFPTAYLSQDLQCMPSKAYNRRFGNAFRVIFRSEWNLECSEPIKDLHGGVKEIVF